MDVRQITYPETYEEIKKIIGDREDRQFEKLVEDMPGMSEEDYQQNFELLSAFSNGFNQ